MAVKPNDYIYLAAGLIGTWWVAEVEKGNRPDLTVLWSTVKVLRTLRRTLALLEMSLLEAIDRGLE